MQLTWKTVDKWREERNMFVSDLARRADIPERTIYAGVKKNSRLRRATDKAVRAAIREFDDEKNEGGR